MSTSLRAGRRFGWVRGRRFLIAAGVAWLAVAAFVGWSLTGALDGVVWWVYAFVGSVLAWVAVLVQVVLDALTDDARPS